MKLPVVTMSVVVGYTKGVGYTKEDREVEVLSVNFNKQTMRIRYKADIFNSGKDSTETPDVPSTAFFEHYFVADLSKWICCELKANPDPCKV